MAMMNPKTRVNYEPNRGQARKQDPARTLMAVFSPIWPKKSGSKLRVRADSFADHYSQALQFYISQTPVEQAHIADSFTFELRGRESRNPKTDGLPIS